MPDLKLGLNDKIGLEKESQLKSRPTKRYSMADSSVLLFWFYLIFLIINFLSLVSRFQITVPFDIVYSHFSFENKCSLFY